MKFFILTVFVLSSLSVFAQDAESPAARKEAKAITALMNTVKALSAQDLSCKTLADCGAVAIGDKACGGPVAYVVVSKKNKNVEEIAYLAQRTQVRQDAFNREYRVFSTSSMTLPPAVNCLNNTCI